MDSNTISGNILYLSYDGLTDPLGQSQILPYLSGLANHGYSITVISFEKNDRYKARKEEIEKICIAASLQWKPMPYHKYPPVISSLFDIYQLRQQVKRLHRAQNFSIVHCRSYITSLVGLWLKRRYKIKFIFDMRGFWADERVEGGLWKLNNPVYKLIYKFFKNREKSFLTKSDHIISLTDNARHEILSWKLKTPPITIIPTCVDLVLFDPERIKEEQKIELKNKIGIAPEDFILMYLGSWGTWYRTEEMLQFFRKFKQVRSASKFLIVTQDQVELNSFEAAKDVIVVKATRQQVPVYISIAHGALFFIKPTYSKKASSATKMAEIMAMNVPVITNKGWGDVEDIFKELGICLFDESKNFELFFKKIDTRTYCENNLSLEIGIGRYAGVYNELIRKN